MGFRSVVSSLTKAFFQIARRVNDLFARRKSSFKSLLCNRVDGEMTTKKSSSSAKDKSIVRPARRTWKRTTGRARETEIELIETDCLRRWREEDDARCNQIDPPVKTSVTSHKTISTRASNIFPCRETFLRQDETNIPPRERNVLGNESVRSLCSIERKGSSSWRFFHWKRTFSPELDERISSPGDEHASITDRTSLFNREERRTRPATDRRRAEQRSRSTWHLDETGEGRGEETLSFACSALLPIASNSNGIGVVFFPLTIRCVDICRWTAKSLFVRLSSREGTNELE